MQVIFHLFIPRLQTEVCLNNEDQWVLYTDIHIHFKTISLHLAVVNRKANAKTLSMIL